MNVRVVACTCLLALLSPCALAVNDPPLAEAWDIRPSGVASSSGDIVLRVTPPDGSDPVEITVPVLSGATDVEVARAIRRALSSQLRSDQFNVSVGDSANVLVTNPRGRAIFGVGLVTSDVDSMRIFVNSTTPAIPVAPPAQAVPASGVPAGGVTPPGASSSLPQNSTPTPTPPPNQEMPTPQQSVPATDTTIRPPD